MRAERTKFVRLLQERISDFEDKAVYEGLRFTFENTSPNQRLASRDELLRSTYVGISTLYIAANTLLQRAKHIESEMTKPPQ